MLQAAVSPGPDPSVLVELKAIIRDLDREDARDRLSGYAPYPKQQAFHAMGRTHRIRGLFGGNQTGKSESASAEVAFHLTGLYPKAGEVFYPLTLNDGSPHPRAGQDVWPDGWTGHRFPRPIKCWVAGLTAMATRDNVQTKLLGPPEDEAAWGNGLIPARTIMNVSRSRGTANAVDSVTVRHVSGKASTVWFKSYEQGRRNWQGPTLDLMLFDEEPDREIWSEGTTRTNAVRDARVMAAFTPLLGMSEVVDLLLAGRSIAEIFGNG